MKDQLFKIVVLVLCLVSFGSFASHKKEYNILDYGAVNDTTTLNTIAVQKAIDACTKAGGGIVRIPAGNYVIGSIKLKSNVTLSLDYGASLLGSQDINDYATDLIPAREGNTHCLIYAEKAKNITIEGLGVIDGRGTPEAFPRKNGAPRPRLLRMVNCDGLTFSKVTYKRPAFWGIHIIDSKNVHFNGTIVRFRNNGYNNDGLDIDGCENVLIENCDVDAGDDAICLKSTLKPCKNIEVKNCIVSSNTAALKFGTSSRGGFIDVKVSNCYFYDCPMGGIKLQLVDGGRLENVDISRIIMEDVGNPIFIRLGNRGRNYENFEYQKYHKNAKPEGVPVGTVKNIKISDVVANVKYQNLERATYKEHKKQTPEKERKMILSKTGPIMIAGIPGHYVENVVLENIKISYPGGVTEKDITKEIPEDIARYPEQFFFGVLPAWGAYIRHAKNIEFKNVVLTKRSNDAREEIVQEDVENFTNN